MTTTGDFTYDEAKDYIDSCDLRFQRFLPTTDGYAASRYDVFARQLVLRPDLYGVLDVQVLARVYGLRARWEWEGPSLRPRSVERIIRFKHGMLTTAIGVLKRMRRNSQLFYHEINLMRTVIRDTEDREDIFRVQERPAYLARRMALVRAKWPNLAHHLNWVEAYQVGLRSSIERLQEACLAPDALAPMIADARWYINGKRPSVPPVPLYLAEQEDVLADTAPVYGLTRRDVFALKIKKVLARSQALLAPKAN